MAELLHQLLEEARERAGDAVACTDRGAEVTWNDMTLRSARLAGWLGGEMGLTHGDRVVVAVPATADAVALVYAAARIGAVVAMVHEQLHGARLEHVLRDAEPALLVIDDEPSATLAQGLGVATATSAALAEAAARDRLAPTVPEPAPGDLVLLMYTSGSTSMPKAVMSTHEQVLYAARAIQARLEYRADDVVYCNLPISFDYGLYQIFLCALGGSHLWLSANPHVGPALANELRVSQASVFPAMPHLADILARLLERRPAELPRLRLLTNTGAAMSTETLARLRRALPSLRVQLMYGLTECKRVSIMPVDGDLERPGSCGLPLDGTEVEVVDEDGNALPPGSVGQFVVRGPHVMAGYWRRPDAGAIRFREDADGRRTLWTGDYGSMDEAGFLYMVGRRDDVYKQHGLRTSTLEVEAAALRVPGVEDAAVVPPQDASAAATLIVTGSVVPERALHELRGELEEAKIPSRCIVLPSLPRTANGKVDRRKLEELVA